VSDWFWFFCALNKQLAHQIPSSIPPPSPTRERSRKSNKAENNADAKAPVNSKDSGAVEIVVSRLSTDISSTTTNAKTKKKNMGGHVHSEVGPLSVQLYYRRESHSGQKTWVLIAKTACLPNADDNGAMVGLALPGGVRLVTRTVPASSIECVLVVTPPGGAVGVRLLQDTDRHKLMC
jgi:hypothetical protein